MITIQAFENQTLSLQDFDHAAHVKLAWLYLSDLSLPEALVRFCRNLKKWIRGLGKLDHYHETLTIAYLLLINERIARLGGSHRWEDFACANQDIVQGDKALLRRYYRDETLTSALARTTFLFPDKNSAA